MTNAETMVETLEKFLRSGAGTKEVTVDGQKVVFDREGAIKELMIWKKMAAKESGNRKLFRTIDLSGL